MGVKVSVIFGDGDELVTEYIEQGQDEVDPGELEQLDPRVAQVPHHGHKRVHDPQPELDHGVQVQLFLLQVGTEPTIAKSEDERVEVRAQLHQVMVDV